MIINLNTIKNENRCSVIETILKKIYEIGISIKNSDLEWAIKMEDSYNNYGNLTDKQLFTLVKMLARYENRKDERY
jgi:hypothetical protein